MRPLCEAVLYLHDLGEMKRHLTIIDCKNAEWDEQFELVCRT